MKIFAPSYYKNFKCLADRCTHSCCIGWEIDVDADTLLRYEQLTGDYAPAIRESIEKDADTGVSHFKLASKDRCPHLDECGLCKIITEYGEGALSEICREHPRFYNLTERGIEVGLGASCEEAARLILSSDCFYDDTYPIGEADEESTEYPDGIDFSALKERDSVFALLRSENLSYEKKLNELAKRYGKAPGALSDADWHELLGSLEYLDEESRKMFLSYTAFPKAYPKHEPEQLRFLSYLIYRHTSCAANLKGFSAALGFALFCERLFASLIAKYCDTGAGYTPKSLAVKISEELEYSPDNTESIITEFQFM